MNASLSVKTEPFLRTRAGLVYYYVRSFLDIHDHRPSLLQKKVMHDAHDQAMALARLLDHLHPQSTTPGAIITSLLDLQLACESLGGGALNNLEHALRSFGLRRDLDRCVRSIEEN